MCDWQLKVTLWRFKHTSTDDFFSAPLRNHGQNKWKQIKKQKSKQNKQFLRFKSSVRQWHPLFLALCLVVMMTTNSKHNQMLSESFQGEKGRLLTTRFWQAAVITLKCLECGRLTTTTTTTERQREITHLPHLSLFLSTFFHNMNERVSSVSVGEWNWWEREREREKEEGRKSRRVWLYRRFKDFALKKEGR